jgi:Protein of unknown function (DUF3383).
MAQAKGSRGRTMMAFSADSCNDPIFYSGDFQNLPFNTNGLVSTQNQNDSTVIRPNRNAAMPFRGNIEAAGDITVPMDQRNFGFWLRTMFGSPTTTTLNQPTTLYGGRGVSIHFGNWRRINAGALNIRVDDNEAKTISGLDFSGVTTYNDIAGVLQTAIQAEYPDILVAWDMTFQRFQIQSLSATKIHPFTMGTGSTQPLVTMLKLSAVEGAISRLAETLYRHEFKVPEEQPYYNIEKGFTDIGSYHLFTGCKTQNLSFTAQGDGELTASITVMGSKEVLQESSFDSTPVAALKEDNFNNFQAFITKDGEILGNSTQANLAIDFDLDGDTFTLSSMGYRTGINEGIVKPSGNLVMFFENQKMLAQAIEGTPSMLVISFANGPSSLSFEMGEVQFDRTSPAIEGPAGVRVDVGYRAYLNENPDGTAIKAVLINDVSSY